MGRLRKKTLSNDEAHVQLTHLLNEHGKKEEMKELLMNHLKETGWRDQVSIAICTVNSDGARFSVFGSISCSFVLSATRARIFFNTYFNLHFPSYGDTKYSNSFS